MADTMSGKDKPQASAHHSQTVIENNTIVTPYAFQVSPELLGEPLASPARRGIAQCIDLILLYFISHANGLILGALAALTFMRAGSNVIKGKGRTTRGKLLRLGAACLLGFIVYTTFDDPGSSTGRAVAENRVDSGDIEADLAESLRPALVGVSGLIWKACSSDFSCLQETTEEFFVTQAEMGAELSELKALQTRFLEGTTMISDEQKATLIAEGETGFQRGAERFSKQVAQPDKEAEKNTYDESASDSKHLTKQPDNAGAGAGFLASLRNLLHDGQAFLSELGLGLGWAALYYSAFTAYMQGCTPGKWITRIRVLRLDGRPPTLWESFGRYGGYGAGFATGMLGFFQIYWDANRQSIQDKIAETLVVRHSVKALAKPTNDMTSGTSGEGI